MSGGVKKNIKNFASIADKTVQKLNKIDIQFQQTKRTANNVKKFAIPFGLLGFAADCLYHRSFSFSFPSIMSTFTGITVYLVCRNIISVRESERGKKIDQFIETFDEEFAGFKVIAMYLMEDFLRNSPQSHKEIFRNYILNIHNSHARLMEIKKGSELSTDSTFIETRENFIIARDNAERMVQSYESVEQTSSL